MRACISLRSLPALNARPAPVNSTTATSGSSAAAVQCLGGGLVERLVERVERVGPVQGERADPVLVVDLEYHGCLLNCVKGVFST